MKKLLPIFLILLSSSLFSQVPYCVAPLKPGNIWVYTELYSNYKMVFEVTDSIVNINNNKYFQVKEYEFYPGRAPAHPLVYYFEYRFDSLEGTYKHYDRQGRFANSDYTYYKKGSVPGDWWKTKEGGLVARTVYSTVMDTASVRIFKNATLLTRYVFICDSNLTNYAEYWTDELGVVKRVSGDEPLFLTGCVIDGKIYGDTSRTPTGILDNDVKQKETFCLYQNYPNPFNPSTKIRFTVPEYSYVSLKIFSVLGKEITTIVNEYKAPGTYEEYFHGDNLPSGIYTYRLKAVSYGDGEIFERSAKLLLVK